MQKLILASASPARRAILAAAGLDFVAIPGDVDEAALKAASNAAPETLALNLALAKAKSVARTQPAALVVGADQILVCDDKLFDKPANLAAAATQLRALRGRPHRLVTAACAVRASEILWTHVETPQLTMRDFSDSFLADYLKAEGETICASVGAYRLEARGINLFETIEGNYFTILGLPLLGLLGFLRQAGAAAA